MNEKDYLVVEKTNGEFCVEHYLSYEREMCNYEPEFTRQVTSYLTYEEAVHTVQFLNQIEKLEELM